MPSFHCIVTLFDLMCAVLQPEDEGREFTLTYYTLDNTMSVYEPPKRNSGIIGGKFLSRREIKDINNDNLPRVRNKREHDAHSTFVSAVP